MLEWSKCVQKLSGPWIVWHLNNGQKVHYSNTKFTIHDLSNRLFVQYSDHHLNNGQKVHYSNYSHELNTDKVRVIWMVPLLQWFSYSKVRYLDPECITKASTIKVFLLVCNFSVFWHCKFSLLQSIFQFFRLNFQLLLGLGQVPGHVLLLQLNRLAKLFKLFQLGSFLGLGILLEMREIKLELYYGNHQVFRNPAILGF